MKFLLSLGGVIVLSVLVLGAFGSRSASGSETCGPGEDWIPPCTAGTDRIPDSTLLAGIDATGNCTRNANFVLSGPVEKITRTDANAGTIETEIVEMQLTGGGLTIRVGTGTPNINAGVQQTLGEIVEQPANTRLGDSFFDVFFEIVDAPGSTLIANLGGPFYNQTAVRIEAVIRQVPPQAVYLHPEDLCVDLWTAPVGGTDTGLNLVEAKHDTRTGDVGGTVELLSGGDGTDAFDAEAGGFSFALYAALAGGFAAAAVALAAGGWHARRRWMR